MATVDQRPNADETVSGRIFLVRHGRTALNADGRLRGRLDPPLDDIGEREVLALARTLAEHRIVRIVASPLTRAMQTAQAIGQATWQPVTALSALLDRDYGRWAGEREDEVVRRFGSLDAAPGVEPLSAVTQRACVVAENQREMLTHGDVVMVSHDAVTRALLVALDPALAMRVGRLGQRTACWNEIRMVGERWVVVEVDRKSPVPVPDEVAGA